MTYAMIENGVAVNIIVADKAFAARIGAVLCPDGFGIGDLYDGTTWTKAPEPPQPEPEPTAEELISAFLEGYANE